MVDLPSPDEIEEQKRASGIFAASVREYFEQLRAAGFSHDEAMELTVDYQSSVLGDT